MSFVKKYLPKSILGYLSFLSEMLNSNWSNQVISDKRYDDQGDVAFGNYFGQYLDWYRNRPEDLFEVLMDILWFLWVIFAVLPYKTVGIVFKILIWVGWSPIWLFYSITRGIKFGGSATKSSLPV